MNQNKVQQSPFVQKKLIPFLTIFVFLYCIPPSSSFAIMVSDDILIKTIHSYAD